MNIAVIGLGKIGLPLAVQFARKSHCVIGVDISAETVEKINSGKAPFPGEAHLDRYLVEVINSGKLQATTNLTDAVARSKAVVIVVPLLSNHTGTPNFKEIDAVTRSVGHALKKGTLVSYETTLPVGTTRTRFAPELERLSGLQVGQDFHLVFSPERVSTGQVFEDLRTYPKLIGGINPESEKHGVDFYSEVLDFDQEPGLIKANGVWSLGSCEAAEFAKLAETTYRDVNIALANQFAIFAESKGIDIIRVIEACNSQPYSQIHQPGIAVGGHCIPVYSQFYLWNDPTAKIVLEAREVNKYMPEHVVRTLEKLHGSLKGERVLILGASYRGGVKETAFSGVFPTSAALQSRGAIVAVQDPMFNSEELRALGINPYVPGQIFDAAIVQSNHQEYFELDSSQFIGVRTIIDGRNILNANNWKKITFHAIGGANEKLKHL